MLASIPFGLYVEWAAFESIDPSSEERADVRAATVACTVANSLRGKRGRRYKLKDFLPDYMKGKRRQSPEEMRQVLRAYMAAASEARKNRCRQ